ncbi:MAG: hypothetical protein E7146_02065 [Rikenellaceae bacterium]|nr:hypothetical protein [Rikenellaceae bacterium]
MKIFKTLSLAFVVLLAAVACDKGGDDNNDKKPVDQSGSFENIEKEWKLVSVNDAPAEFNVYISFSTGLFALYQQMYTLDYQFYEGEYNVDGGTLSGSYFDAGAWKCEYTGGVSADGNTLTLVSKDANPITSVYEACTIPEDVKEEATATRGVVDVTPYL